MARNLQAEIKSVILSIRKNLMRIRQIDKDDESRISYVVSLLNLFTSLEVEVSLFSSDFDRLGLLNILGEIERKLSFNHLPKKSFDRLVGCLISGDISFEFTKLIDNCNHHKAEFYRESLDTFLNDNKKNINNNEFNKLEKRIEALNTRINILLANGEKKIDGIQKDISKKGSDALVKLQQEISDLQASTKLNVTDQIEGLRIELLKSKNELIALVGDLESYKRIINHKSEEEVSKHYAKKAFWEMLTYWAATILSIVIIIISLKLAWTGLESYYKTYVAETNLEKLKALAQTAEYAKIYLGFRLVLSFLLFSTVIYTSRIAYRAYIHWRHSESMKLKLSSLRPFINQLEPDDRKQIHKDLVPDYFGKDAGMIDVAGEKFKDFPTNVSAVVMKAMDHANGALGNSKKDEPAKDDKSSAEKDKKEEA